MFVTKRLLALIPAFAFGFVIVFVGALTVNVQAQSGRPWSAWMYTSRDGTITQVARDGGIINQIYLPLTPITNVYGARVVVSPSGRYIAYTASDNTGVTPGQQLLIFDVQVGSIVFSYDLSDAALTGFEANSPQSALPHQTAFDEANGQFAFGYLRESDWRIVVGSLTSGAEFASITSASAPPEVADEQIIPAVHGYDGQHVIFQAITPDESSSEVPAFGWNIGTGAVQSNGIYSSLVGDLLPTTGELVIPAFDGALTAVEADRANVLDVFVPASGGRMAFYHEGGLILERADFIEDGARVLAETLDPASGQRTLRVLNRDGSVAGEFAGNLEAIHGTPDGFVGTFDSPNGLALAYVDTTTETYSPVTLWTSGGAPAQLAAVVAEGAAKPAFGEWGRIN